MTAAERQRRYRQRVRERKRVARVPVSGEWIDALVESGWLQDKDAVDWEKVEAATGRVLQFLSEREFSVTRNASTVRKLLLSDWR